MAFSRHPFTSLNLSTFYIFASLLSMKFVAVVSKQPYMEKNQICGNMTDLKGNGCLLETRIARGEVECALHCDQNLSCIGTYIDDNEVCHFVKVCKYVADNLGCSTHVDNVSVSLFMKVCQNGGKYVDPASKPLVTGCRCYNHWAGQTCERVPQNCREIMFSGFRNGVSYKLDLEVNDHVTKTQCMNYGTSSKMMVMYSTGDYDNKRTWEEYKRGFFNGGRNFWLGLENMHVLFPLFDGDDNLKIFVRFWKDDTKTDSDSVYVEYANFRVSNESLGYRYSYESIKYSGFSELGLEPNECMGDTVGAPFSTWDRDNDIDPDNNCAKLSSSGWWFKNCSSPVVCNPLGKKIDGGSESLEHWMFSMYGLNMLNNTIGYRLKSVSMAFYKTHPNNQY